MRVECQRRCEPARSVTAAVSFHRPLQLRHHRRLLSVGGAAGEDQPAQVSVRLEREGSNVHGLLRSQRQHGGMFGGTCGVVSFLFFLFTTFVSFNEFH